MRHALKLFALALLFPALALAEAGAASSPTGECGKGKHCRVRQLTSTGTITTATTVQAEQLTSTDDVTVTDRLSTGALTVKLQPEPYVRRASYRRSMWWSPGGTGTSSLTATGAAVLAVTGTPAASAQTWWNMISVVHAAATSGLCAGHCGASSGITRFNFRPRAAFAFRTDSAINLRRTWFGVTETDLAGVTHATTQAHGTDFVALGFDTSISGTLFRCCSGDGGTATCEDIPGATIIANTNYILTVDYSVSGYLTCSVFFPGDSYPAPYSLTKTTNLPTNNVNLAIQNSTTTLEAVVKTHYIAHVELEEN